MSIAHFLTLLRFVIAPLFPLLYFGYEALGLSFVMATILLLAFLCIGEVTDLFDGFFARRRNQVTDLGKILDPVADTVIHISIFFTFTQGVVALPIWLVLMFLYRELVIGALRTLCALKGSALSARLSGKVKAVMQGGVCAAIMVLMLLYGIDRISLAQLQQISFVLALCAAVYTLFSAVDYIQAHWAHIRKAV